jgi:hypothetical protein
MSDLAHNIAQLNHPAGLPRAIQSAAAEVLIAAENADHHVAAVSWFNPASTPEHHVPGFPNQGGVAVDFMVYGNKAVQDFIDGYLWKHRARLGVCWIISRKRIRSTSPGHPGTWTAYNEPDPHTSHTHTNFGHLAGTNGYIKLTKISYHPPEDDMPSLNDFADAVLGRDGQIENVFGDKGAGEYVALKTAIKHLGEQNAAVLKKVDALAATVAKLSK